jgi:UDP-glucose 4-epimerase
MKKILITGGAGYIGSHAVKLFLEKGLPVVVLDNFSRGYREPMEILSALGDLSVEEADLLDADAVKDVFARHDIGTVIHFAALCLVNESVEEPERYMRNNVEGTRNLLEAMRVAGVRDIIFSSTCAVYGETRTLPVDERHPTDPVNPYGASKFAAENLIREYAGEHDFHFVIFRYFNVCGAATDGSIGDSKKPSQLLMQNAVRGAMGIEPFAYTCAPVDTPDGTPIRDYIDVEDLVAAHFGGYEYLLKGGANDTFNLGNGKGFSVKEIVSEVEKAFGTTMEKSQVEPRKGEYAKIYADPAKAREAIGFDPKKSLVDSIESLRKWYSGHPDGYPR